MTSNIGSMSMQNVVKNVSTISQSATVSVNTVDETKIISEGEAAVYEKSEQNSANTKNTYTKDEMTLKEINTQIERKFSALRATVEALFNTQGVKSGQAQGLNYDQIMEKYDGKLQEFYQNLEVDDSTRLTAQQEISEDGFWGVKQTSERAIDFAKALSGGDPSKIEVLKKSIEEAYQAAEKSWGGELPELCKQTQEATLKGFDDWAQDAKK